ncbi:Paired amphipathic helix protein Sin3b [Gryganskiella cystojenkinii]|nr:Paired amphipathic helix protein Sin3b [Gryganskiella cystojenkinii]
MLSHRDNKDSQRQQQEEDPASSAASFAHSLSSVPLSDADTLHDIALSMTDSTHSTGTNISASTQQAMNMDIDLIHNQSNHSHHHHHQQHQQQQQQQEDQEQQQEHSHPQHDNHNDILNNINTNNEIHLAAHNQPEARMAVAELLVSLAHSSDQQQEAHSGLAAAAAALGGVAGASPQSPIYRNAVDYVGSVKKAYESNPRVYTEFLEVLEKYHDRSLSIDQLVRTVMGLFQDQPELLMGFKEFLPEAQGLLNQLVPPMMYSDYKERAARASNGQASTVLSAMAVPQIGQEAVAEQAGADNGHAAADFLGLIKERSLQEPDMYQHMITLLRKFQKDHSYSSLYFYISIVLRYHPHLLHRFHKFLPTVTSGIEVQEPRIISKAPPEDLVVSPDFIEAKDFVQTVKYEAKRDMSMYDRFIFALEKYQRTGWTIDQVYSEVSLIFWNHPDCLAGFKQFITTIPQQP